MKTAIIAGGSLWQRIGSGAALDRRVILDCIRCKLAVVAADERDGGRRQVLNLGHTVGHALETATGYARYRHGEAVGLGLLAALRLSGSGELRAQVETLLDVAVFRDARRARGGCEEILAAMAATRSASARAAVSRSCC